MTATRGNTCSWWVRTSLLVPSHPSMKRITQKPNVSPLAGNPKAVSVSKSAIHRPPEILGAGIGWTALCARSTSSIGVLSRIERLNEAGVLAIRSHGSTRLARNVAQRWRELREAIRGRTSVVGLAFFTGPGRKICRRVGYCWPKYAVHKRGQVRAYRVSRGGFETIGLQLASIGEGMSRPLLALAPVGFPRRLFGLGWLLAEKTFDVGS